MPQRKPVDWDASPRKKASPAATAVRYLIALAIVAGGSFVALTRYHDHVAVFYGWGIIALILASAVFIVFCFLGFLVSSLHRRMLNLPKLALFIAAAMIFVTVTMGLPRVPGADNLVRHSAKTVISECSIPEIYYTLSGTKPPARACCPYDVWGIRRDGKRSGDAPPRVPTWCCEPMQGRDGKVRESYLTKTECDFHRSQGALGELEEW